MITFIRTATMAPGKTVEAVTFAHQVAQLVEKITGTKSSVSVATSGNPSRIAWTSTAPDSATAEAAMLKMVADPEYMKLTEGAAPYFLPGTIYDEWWRTV